MAVRQFHVAAYARIDDDGRLVEWEVWEGADLTPEGSVWNEGTERWEHASSDVDLLIWDQLDAEFGAAIDRLNEEIKEGRTE